MILDQLALFSSAQAITSAAASTSSMDLGPGAVRDIGNGQELFLSITVDVAFTDGSSDSALTVAIEGDSTSTITPDATADVLTIPALTAAGTQFIVPLAPGLSPLQLRYIQLKYTPTNGNLTTGSITAALVIGVQRAPAYADNSRITG